MTGQIKNANRDRTFTAMIAVVSCWPPNGLANAQTDQAPGGAVDSVEALTAIADPLADDWETEKAYVAASARLKQFGEALRKAAGGDSDGIGETLRGFFTDAAIVEFLRPDGGERYSIDGYDIRRWQRAGEPIPAAGNRAAAVRSLLAAVPHPAEWRFAFKTVGVERIDDRRFVTHVLFQAFARPTDKNGGRAFQYDGHWRVAWSSTDGVEHPLIGSIQVDSFSEVDTRNSAWVDCTGAVLRDAAAWRQLARGGEYWFGRTDALGELNFMGHNGIAVGDVNGDGRDDIYVAMGTGLPNKLLVQQGDGTVKDTADEAGVAWLDDTKGVILADMDNDGDQDLLCAIGPTIVYQKNDGRGHFTPFRGMRASSPASFYSLAVADYDLDGDLDVYGCRYVNLRYGVSVPMPLHDANNGPPNHMLRNDGEAGFVDVTTEVGLNVNNTRFSLAATWIDYDGDGDSDLHVVNDFGRNNLYRNDGAKFVDVAGEAGVEDQAAGMGATWSDFDRDGDFDLYVSNMFSSAGQRIAYQPRFKSDAAPSMREQIQRHSLGNSLFVNRGDGRFDDISDAAGVRMGRWAWGAKFVDFNNDGWDDLFVPNGFLTNDRKDDL
ncbi:MAG: VCBS repeat-containing protein [Phycisphaerales bacterium]|nr:VCBS repeat-containing protein [Phycisphaerales bacterium]